MVICTKLIKFSWRLIVENSILASHLTCPALYAPQPHLTAQVTEIIRRVRPDVLRSVDPGQWYTRWHKTDHRMAALNTVDAIRAAEFWLYFPNQKLQLRLKPFRVAECISSTQLRKK